MYNGWTNYETWRVKLELFEDDAAFQGWTADNFEEIAEELICNGSSEDSLARDYALAFLRNVNWYEIAKRVQDEF